MTASLFTLPTRKVGVPTAAATTALFTITGGLVRVDALFGVVTTTVGVGLVTAIFNANPSGAGADTPLSIASASLAAVPAGTILSISGVATAAPIANVGTGGGVGLANILIIQPGTIDVTFAIGDASGVFDFYCSWSPLVQGAMLL